MRAVPPQLTADSPIRARVRNRSRVTAYPRLFRTRSAVLAAQFPRLFALLLPNPHGPLASPCKWPSLFWLHLRANEFGFLHVNSSVYSNRCLSAPVRRAHSALPAPPLEGAYCETSLR